MSEQGFIVVNKKIEARVRANMREQDVTPAVLTLVRAAVAVHEHAFHHPEVSKKMVLGVAVDGFDGGVAYRAKSLALLKDRKVALRDVLTSANLRRAFGYSYMHAATATDPSRDAFVAFVGDAWDAGAHQYAVNEGTVEGSLNNEYGVAMIFACHLAMWGKQKGLVA